MDDLLEWMYAVSEWAYERYVALEFLAKLTVLLMKDPLVNMHRLRDEMVDWYMRDLYKQQEEERKAYVRSKMR